MMSNLTFIKSVWLSIMATTTVSLLCWQCREPSNTIKSKDEATVPENLVQITTIPQDITPPSGMVWIPGGTFTQGARSLDAMALPHEKPAHPVAVDGFFIDITEVTNAQFAQFIEETQYVTLAERAVEWETLKQQLPPGVPKPHDSLLQPGALVFKKSPAHISNLSDYTQWWVWIPGASWKHPYGPDSTIKSKAQHPVVHIAYEDAMAYCKWAGRRLPTEAEWELAARGNFSNAVYTWGEDHEIRHQNANTWEGNFPVSNTEEDGYENIAPVMSYPPNTLGVYDMAGNVWEWTQDWYHVNYYAQLKEKGWAYNPKGATEPYNPHQPRAMEKVIKGGSFLCNASYCASYRISARMATSYDTALGHLGFRTVASPNMLKAPKKEIHRDKE